MPSENVPFAIVKALKLVVSKSEKGEITGKPLTLSSNGQY
jgi:hypothetical protein